jgi:hypothetical protein
MSHQNDSAGQLTAFQRLADSVVDSIQRCRGNAERFRPDQS